MTDRATRFHALSGNRKTLQVPLTGDTVDDFENQHNNQSRQGHGDHDHQFGREPESHPEGCARHDRGNKVPLGIHVCCWRCVRWVHGVLSVPLVEPGIGPAAGSLSRIERNAQDRSVTWLTATSDRNTESHHPDDRQPRCRYTSYEDDLFDASVEDPWGEAFWYRDVKAEAQVLVDEFLDRHRRAPPADPTGGV